MNLKKITFENIFNFKRFCYLCKIEFIDRWKLFLTINGIIAIIYLFSNILFASSKYDINNLFGFLFISLFIGLINTSHTFNYLYIQEKAAQFYLLPASIEEKYLVKLLFTSILYLIFTFIILMLTGIFIGILKFGLLKWNLLFLSNFKFNFFNIFLPYMFFHSAFLYGSILFKKNNIIKTLLALLILICILMIILYILSLTISSYYYILSEGIINLFRVPNLIHNNSNLFFSYTSKILLYLIPVGFYLLTYYKLKKIEVK